MKLTQKKTWFFAVFGGMQILYITQLYRDYFISYYKDPLKRCVFLCLSVAFVNVSYQPKNHQGYLGCPTVKRWIFSEFLLGSLLLESLFVGKTKH